MTVLAPLLLAALLALAVPVVLHLRRQRESPRSFPALRYLEDTLQQASRTLRLRDRLLLLLRLALLVLLVLGAARLVLPVGSGTHPAAAVVLVVDDGIRAGTVVEDRRLLDHYRDDVEDLLEAAGPADRFWLVHGTPTPRVRGPLTAHGIRTLLPGLEPGSTPADVDVLLRLGADLLDLRGEDHRHLVLVGVDPPPAGTPHPQARLGASVTLPPNTGIRGVTTSPAPPLPPGEPVRILVELAGDSVAERIVRFIPARNVDHGVASPDHAASAPSDARGRAELELPPMETEGWLLGHVEIDADALRADDRAPVVLPVGGRVPVHLDLDGDEASTRWLREGLALLREAGRAADAGEAPGSAWLRVVSGVRAIELLEDSAPLPPSAAILVVPPRSAALLPRLDRALADRGVPWRITAGGGDDLGGLVTVDPSLPDGLGEALAPVSPGPVRRLEPRTGTVPAAAVRIRTGAGHPWLVEARTGEHTIHLLASDGSDDFLRSPAGVLLLDALLAPTPGTRVPDAGFDLPVLPPAATTPGGAPPPPEARDVPEGDGLTAARTLLHAGRGREVSGWLLWVALALLVLEARAARTRNAPVPPTRSAP